MEPTLLVGDRIFVSKYSYGYSKHSFPFSPPIINNRMLSTKAKYGDLVVFKTPEDNRTDFIKRLVGLPGDKIQIKNGELFINEKKIPRENLTGLNEIMCGGTKTEVVSFNETLPNGVQYKVVYNKIGSMKNSDIYKVPEKHYFFLGDNRDCSRDSRFLSSVGYVHENNLVGKARVIFFSNNTHKGSILKFWNWDETLRLNRFFKKLK
tara:strand:- start:1180 stop:1800 length:621 start_codon:yes stop_codon:yes gene_type:complete